MATNSSDKSIAAMFHTTGERVYALRREKGCTQGDLAELLETTKATISRYESNLIDIPRTKLQKLAEYFRVTPAFLMCWTDDTKGTAEVFEGVSQLPKADYDNLIFGEPPLPVQDRIQEDRQEKELLEIFRALSVRGQTKLLSTAYELQELESVKTSGGFTKAPILSPEELQNLLDKIEGARRTKYEPPKKEKQAEKEIDYAQEFAALVDSLIKDDQEKK